MSNGFHFYLLQTKKHPPNHIKRPMNAFMVWSQEERKKLDNSHTTNHATFSKDLGTRWKQLDKDEKEHYYGLARHLKYLHSLEYPNYKYQPKKKRCDPSLVRMKRTETGRVTKKMPNLTRIRVKQTKAMSSSIKIEDSDFSPMYVFPDSPQSSISSIHSGGMSPDRNSNFETKSDSCSIASCGSPESATFDNVITCGSYEDFDTPMHRIQISAEPHQTSTTKLSSNDLVPVDSPLPPGSLIHRIDDGNYEIISNPITPPASPPDNVDNIFSVTKRSFDVNKVQFYINTLNKYDDRTRRDDIVTTVPCITLVKDEHPTNIKVEDEFFSCEVFPDSSSCVKEESSPNAQQQSQFDRMISDISSDCYPLHSIEDEYILSSSNSSDMVDISSEPSLPILSDDFLPMSNFYIEPLENIDCSVLDQYLPIPDNCYVSSYRDVYRQPKVHERDPVLTSVNINNNIN